MPGPGSRVVPKIKPDELTTVEARKLHRDDRKALDEAWARDVKRFAKYRCQVTDRGGHFGAVDAHHVRAKSTNPEDRYDPCNGLCTCRLHHNLLQTHRIEVVYLEPEKGTRGRMRFQDGPAA